MRPGEINVLLIEDNPGDAELVKKAFARSGSRFRPHHSERLAHGIEQLTQKHFDLVLLDLSLPDSDGLGGLKRIREVAPDVPIVVLTSLDSEQTAVSALEQGAQDYLVKHEVIPEVLNRTVRYAIHRQQSRTVIEKLLAEVRAHGELMQRKNRRLARLYKMAHRFVDNVSHEFRTPLTVIKEYVSLVREGLIGEINEEQARMLDIVSVRADDLNTMVDDMLDVSKLEAGVLAVWRKSEQIADIVEHVRPGLERKAAVRDVTLEFRIDERLPAVYCDAEKAARVIINLAVNAIKFSGKPGVVRVWAKRSDNGRDVLLGVTDNGPGIPPEALTEIFKRFKQLEAAVRGSTKGFGLGLNIARELVALNFGEMHIESTVGQGSTFAFTVPISEPREILRRYLRRLRRVAGRSAVVSLLAVGIGEQTEPDLAEDVDAFLNYLLRRNDLLFRVNHCCWIVVLSAGREERLGFLARAAEAIRDVNRNRPRGPLPEIDIRTTGAWRIARGPRRILRKFERLTEPGSADAAPSPAATAPPQQGPNCPAAAHQWTVPAGA
ncbi:MAG: ATP-binding protein [Planctomycetota bacterium]